MFPRLPEICFTFLSALCAFYAVEAVIAATFAENHSCSYLWPGVSQHYHQYQHNHRQQQREITDICLIDQQELQ